MNPKHVAAFAVAGVLLLAVGFLVGLFVHGGAPEDASRQELTKRLVSTKAAIEAGLNFASLGTEETQLRAAAELADRRLSDSERKVVADAIFAVHQTRSAWQIMLAECVALGYFFLAACAQNLLPLMQSLNLPASHSLGDIVGTYPFNSQNAVLKPFLSVCLTRIQAAIDLMSR